VNHSPQASLYLTKDGKLSFSTVGSTESVCISH